MSSSPNLTVPTVSILGVGYTGMVQAACFASAGVKVIVRDNNPVKNNALRNGESTVIEPSLQEVFTAHRDNITIEDEIGPAVQKSDISFVCVGTPSEVDGSVDLRALWTVADEAGQALVAKNTFHVFVIRSTVPPGTTLEFASRVAKRSGKQRGPDFDCIMQPEFLREGSGVEDFLNPSFTVLGTDSERASDLASRTYHALGITDNIFTVPFAEAEIFKYLNNAFHTLLLCFSNETVRLTHSVGGDPFRLLNIFIRDTKLNISPYYLIAGLPWGGSCLPKDARAVERLLSGQGVNAPILTSLLRSNEQHYAFVFDRLLQKIDQLTVPDQSVRVGLVGLAFKRGVDDIRESPFIRLFQFLNSRGFNVTFFDPLLDEKRLLGRNAQYIQSLFRDFFSYQRKSVEQFLSDADVIVLAGGNGIEDLLATKDELANKHIVCLNPKLYRFLDDAKVKYITVV